MPTWPVSLPIQPLVEGYDETLPYDGDRSSIDGLPIVQVQRSKAAVRPMTVNMDLTSAQVDTFQTFYRTTLGFGALAFDFTFPRTGVIKTFRCIGGRPPAATPKGYDLYTMNLSMEVLP